MTLTVANLAVIYTEQGGQCMNVYVMVSHTLSFEMPQSCHPESVFHTFSTHRTLKCYNFSCYLLPVCFAYPEQGLLPRPSSLFEKLMRWESSVDVAKYHLKNTTQSGWFRIRYILTITFSSGVSLVTRMR